MVIDKSNELTIAQAAEAIAAGKLTAGQLVDACLQRIDSVEDKIRAWAWVDHKGATLAAHQLDDELRQGKRRGPLHGIPMGIKDIFYTAGVPTQAGAKVCANFVPYYDATAVARLKAAGAIILGKTHTTEFAYFDPAPTRNPWNRDHTPGGSSSGSGAGVAAGMCLAALGSQTVGSTLRPAAFNGIVGFKPHYGRISTYGVIPLAWTLDHVGILARSVEDAAIVFQSIAGHDSSDHHSLTQTVPDCLSKLEGKKAPRLGLVKQYFYDNADEEMRQETERVVELLRQAGAKVREIAVPTSFGDIYANGRTIMAVEAAAYHEQKFAERRSAFGTHLQKLLDDGLYTSSTDYARALEKRLQHYADIQSMFEGVDALLTPATPGAAPYSLAATGNPVMQAPWTITGVPSVAIPTGLNKDGLPLGVQLVSAPLAEARLLAAARWCERVVDWHLRPPLD